MAYGDFKSLTRRTTSDKILRDKVFNVAKNLEFVGHQRGLASMVCKFFDENNLSKELGEELHKQIIRKFKKVKVYSSFIENIWES